MPSNYTAVNCVLIISIHTMRKVARTTSIETLLLFYSGIYLTET